MKRIGFILFVACGLCGVVHIRTDGFSLRLIEGELFAEQTDPLTEEMEKILVQPFHYLNKGRQCFVFASKDGKYVVKFFNQHFFRLPWYVSFIKKEKAKRALRRNFYEQSYTIAYREFGEEILYLHLGPADRHLPIIQLLDKAGREHNVDLHHIPFVLQRKGSSFYAGLDAIYEKEKLMGLYREIDCFLRAVAVRIEKHIADDDSDVEHNWGYVDGHIFHLDPGRLYYDEDLAESARFKIEWNRATRTFHKWLKSHYPEASVYFEKRRSAIVK